ncbi:ferric reductase-like transmembrane domain-containing protein [Clostridium sp. YIM B02505]|uniref:Ferric reductase-like transmembrane domain-containing protein n=1 Tax=Clostridium yunnanense TaxID=2800325 RepID=A0ABS1ESL4_9CLOT|nr:ferric reductase-like transmembrane domain-containing protein [Clostridium yunnanense]MBK1812378.1 ferric reductase-like transmembrane domain-containing protein [Clostridium yunnanense]
MIFIYSLIAVTIFSLVLSSNIKKNPKIYYCIATLITGSTIGFELYRMFSKVKLTGVVNQLERASARGIIAIAFFILVMYAGALSPKLKLTRKLMSIRAELAIIASILMLSHGIVYLVSFIINTVPKLISGQNVKIISLAISIVGIIAFLLMIPLFITSFKKIRKAMKPKVWKKLQTWAYLFYLLAYVHVMFILMKAKHPDWPKNISYTLVFGAYLVLRLIRYKNSKNRAGI